MPDIVALALNPTIDVSAEAEVVRHTHKTRTTDESFEPGGGGVNVARVVTELGGDVEAFCVVGGVTGALLTELLGRIGVPTHIIEVHGNTRMAHMVYERSTGLEYRFIPSGTDLTEAEIESVLDAVRQADFRWLVASGSIPHGASPDILARFGAIAAEKGARFILDTHGPGLEATLGATPIHLVKPSLNELQTLIGHELDMETCAEIAATMVGQGQAEAVAVTMGADGALIATADGVSHLPPLEVEVQSAVGAGDSFVAGITHALADGNTLEDAVMLGAAAGAAAVMSPGTSLCERDDILALHGRMRELTPRPIPVRVPA
ncbi:1-phosphofructokinase family hexose kinase [Bauldia sp.]|uniref:1-phosphofructokinase family hexose kinase n=1 Tax=Bauldia sp. TaxID=2575872 RepID=UPI003BAD7237